MTEQWKDIPNYEGAYMVSSSGKVKSARTNSLLSLHIRGKGYLGASLRGKTFLVHRLVAMAFLPNPENHKTVNHKDGNRSNNYLSNLEWASYKENNEHGIKRNAWYGENRDNSKLDWMRVLTIRTFKGRKGFMQRYFSSLYGVSEKAIQQVNNETTWKFRGSE